MLDSAPVKLSLLLCAFLPAAACIRASAPIAPPSVEAGSIATFAAADPRQVALEGRPSPAAAPLLPSGARYRLVVTNEEIALVVVTPDNRLSGRLRIRPLDRADDGYGATIVIDDFEGPVATIEAWSSAGGLFGEATVGGRRAAWKVRVDADGSLAGERWTARRGSRSAEIEQLRRARAIGADIGALAAELARSGALAPESERAITERAMLAELALELSVRAWEGRGRASLPRIPTVGSE
jgi:hypothetical protein